MKQFYRMKIFVKLLNLFISKVIHRISILWFHLTKWIFCNARIMPFRNIVLKFYQSISTENENKKENIANKYLDTASTNGLLRVTNHTFLNHKLHPRTSKMYFKRGIGNVIAYFIFSDASWLKGTNESRESL